MSYSQDFQCVHIDTSIRAGAHKWTHTHTHTHTHAQREKERELCLHHFWDCYHNNEHHLPNGNLHLVPMKKVKKFPHCDSVLCPHTTSKKSAHTHTHTHTHTTTNYQKISGGQAAPCWHRASSPDLVLGSFMRHMLDDLRDMIWLY